MNVNVGMSGLLILVSVVIFGVGFGVIMFGDPGAKFFAEDILLGLAFFGAGHVLP